MEWFWGGARALPLVVGSTVAIYVFTLVCVRLAGRRTVARMSAFDFLVTIALGSIIGGTAANPDPKVAQAATAVVTLMVLQVGVGLGRLRWPWFRRLVDFTPSLIVEQGSIRHEALRGGVLGVQMTEHDLRTAMRRNGIVRLDRVQAAVLESSGEISISLAPEDVPIVLAQLEDFGHR